MAVSHSLHVLMLWSVFRNSLYLHSISVTKGGITGAVVRNYRSCSENLSEADDTSKFSRESYQCIQGLEDELSCLQPCPPPEPQKVVGFDRLLHTESVEELRGVGQPSACFRLSSLPDQPKWLSKTCSCFCSLLLSRQH